MLIIKKAILHGPSDLRIEEETCDPEILKPGELLARTQMTGFSTGTDLGNYVGRSTEVPGAPDYPRPVGYSNIALVEAVGSNVTSFRPGDRIFSTKPHRSAYIANQTDILVLVPAGVEPEPAALSYFVHLGVVALRQVRYEAGEDVAVIGLGVIGLCTVAIARAVGARVTAVANDAHRAELARSLGAAETLISGKFDPRAVFDGQGADIVVLTANTWSAYRDAMEMARYGARISVLGFPGRAQPAPDFNPLDMHWLYGKQLTIAGAGHLPNIDCAPSDLRFNLRRDLKFVLDQLSSGAFDVSSIISHRFHYSRMCEAYDLALGHSKELCAAVFDWR